MVNASNQSAPTDTNSASQDITTSYTATNTQTQATQAAQQPQQVMQQPIQQQQPMQNQAAMPSANSGQAKAVVGVFKTLSSAEQSVTQLRGSGFTTEEINIISKDPGTDNSAGDDSIMDGTMTGGAIGGIGGLLLSAGALTIPGLGPIIAAGPLAATIAGALGGGVTGGLIDWGIPSDKSEEYNSEISSGNTLAVIKVPETKVAQAVQILTANGAMNVETHATK